MKLPDLPEYASGPTIDGVRYKPPSLSTTQLRAIQREAYIAGLEEAAKLLDELHAKDTLTNYHGFAANKVRALKGEIE